MAKRTPLTISDLFVMSQRRETNKMAEQKQSGFLKAIADRGDRMTPAIKRRIRVEDAIARAVVVDLLNAGYAVSVDNGGDEFEIACSRDADAIMAEMNATDSEHLYVHALIDGKYDKKRSCGWVFLVYGNDGWDVVNDYTTNLEDVLVGMREAVKRAEDGL